MAATINSLSLPLRNEHGDPKNNIVNMDSKGCEEDMNKVCEELKKLKYYFAEATKREKELQLELSKLRREILSLTLSSIKSVDKSTGDIVSEGSSDGSETNNSMEIDEGKTERGSPMSDIDVSSHQRHDATTTETSVRELGTSACESILRLAQERVAQLNAAHVVLHPNPALLTNMQVSTDPKAAKELSRELQVAIGAQMAHISQVEAVTKTTREVASAVTAEIVAIEGKVNNIFSEHSKLAKERLSVLQKNFSAAQDRAAPILTRLKIEAKEVMDVALEEFDKELIRPDFHHCEECCDYSSNYMPWYRHSLCDSDDCCPEEDCAGTECDCWKDDADHDFSVIESAVKTYLKPIGTAENPGLDCQNQNWEEAISRLKAIDLIFERWIQDKVEAINHHMFVDVCVLCSKAWVTVALWISDKAAAEQELTSHLNLLVSTNNKEKSPMSMSMLPYYSIALQLVETSWESCNFATLSSETSKLRLQRLFTEGRYTEALSLAKDSKQLFYEMKALTKVGTFQELSDKFVASLTSKYILTCNQLGEIAKFTAKGQSSDPQLQAKQQYLFHGGILLGASEESDTRKLTTSKKLMEAVVILQPNGVTAALAKEADMESPTKLFAKSLELLQEGNRLFSYFAARLISLLAKEHRDLLFDLIGGIPFQTSHPYETFIIKKKKVELTPIHMDSFQDILLLLDIANQTGDEKMMKGVMTVAEKCREPENYLSLGKHCLKVNNRAAAVKFAQKAFEARSPHHILYDVGEILDFMLELADENNGIIAKLIKVATPCVSAGHVHYSSRLSDRNKTILTKLVQHLKNSNKQSLLLDLKLCQLKNCVDTREKMNLAYSAASAAIKVDRNAVAKATSQIMSTFVTVQITLVASPYGLCHGQFEDGKKLAIDELKKAQQVQGGLFKIATSLVGYQDEAEKFVTIAKKYPSSLCDAFLQQVTSNFNQLNSLQCTTNHQYDRTLCRRCQEKIFPIYKAAAAALYASKAISMENLSKAEDRIKSLLSREKLNSAGYCALVNLFSLVKSSPLTVYAVPQFAGYTQEPFDVSKWDCVAKETDKSSSVQCTILSKSAVAEVGAWVQACLRKSTTLSASVLDRVTQVCEEESLDGEVLLSMDEDDIRQVFGLGLDEEANMNEWLAVRNLSLDISNVNGCRLRNRQHIQWSHFFDRWLRDYPVDPALLENMDSGILCSLEDNEVDNVGTCLARKAKHSDFQEAQEFLSTRIRALRNAVQHASSQGAISIPEAANNDDPFTILVVGGTGAGKSTLLNSLIGEEVLLPTNCMRACTATIIELSYLTSARANEAYVAKIEYLTEDEWNSELCSLCKTISATREEFQSKNKNGLVNTDVHSTDWLVADTPASDAVIKLRSVFGHAMEKDIMAGNVNILQSNARVKGLLSNGTARLAANSAQDLSIRLASEIDSENDTSEGSRWPLIKRVVAEGPWSVLMGGVRLVDTPGLHDDNSARANVVRSYLKQANSIFLVSNIKRAVNDKTTKDLMTLDLRKTLLNSGKLGQLVYVATQTDELVPSEIRENLRLAESTPSAECAAARNVFTKAKLTTDFYIGIESRLRPINRDKASNISFEFPIFTVSSVDFQKLSGIRTKDGAPKTFESEKATEIPALRNFLKSVAAEYARDSASWGNLAGRLIMGVVDKASITSSTSSTSNNINSTGAAGSTSSHQISENISLGKPPLPASDVPSSKSSISTTLLKNIKSSPTHKQTNSTKRPINSTFVSAVKRARMSTENEVIDLCDSSDDDSDLN